MSLNGRKWFDSHLQIKLEELFLLLCYYIISSDNLSTTYSNYRLSAVTVQLKSSAGKELVEIKHPFFQE